MKKKILIIQTFMLIGCMIADAKVVDIFTAQKAAINFYYEKINQEVTVNYNDIFISASFSIKSGDDTVLYIFNINNSGFVIISAEDAVRPVLGYSFEGIYRTDNPAPAFIDWINNTKNQVAGIKALNKKFSFYTDSRWQYFLTEPDTKLKPAKRTGSISPLLTTKWDQLSPYNYLCPEQLDSSGQMEHVPAGCVATALAQIMRYYKYPDQGSGYHAINDWRFPGQLTADFGSTTYNWSNMPNVVTTKNLDVATLIYQCGIAVNMWYSFTGSSASIFAATDAIYSYFKYRPAVYVERSEVTEIQWIKLLIDNLELKEPVLYSGSGTEGHAFVCDGYQDSTFFHFNWGWSGSFNGYFSIDSISPDNFNFTQNQSALFGIAPLDYPYCMGTKILSDSAGEFGDGSGAGYYLNNTNCSWLISLPDTNGRVDLNFLSFKTEAAKDQLLIYDGENNLSHLIGKYSGGNSPGELFSSKNKMYLEFITDSINQDQGWEANYSTITSQAGIENANVNPEISVTPVPANGIIKLTINNVRYSKGKISLNSCLGVKLLSGDFICHEGKAVTELNLTGFTPGIYLLVIDFDGSSFTKKIIVNKL